MGSPIRGAMTALLDAIEAIGNRLPDPITLFAAGAVAVLLLSEIGARMEWEVDKPTAQAQTQLVLDSGTGEPVSVLRTATQGGVPQLLTDAEGVPLRAPLTEPVIDDGQIVLERVVEPVRIRSLLSADGFRWVLDHLVHNFTSFHPLGVVLVAMLGIGLAEKVGLIGAGLKGLMLITPSRLLHPAMVGIGILSSLAADAGYVVLPPIAAALYRAVGRSPLVGIAAVFAGVAAGFSANLVITSLDPLLAGLSTVGAQIVDPTYEVLPTANLYFMIASAGLLTLVGWGVTAWFVEPRFEGLPPEEGGASPPSDEDRAVTVMTAAERRGLWMATLAGVVALLACASLIWIPGMALYSPPGQAPLWGQAVVPMLFFIFLVVGLAYGVSTDTLRTQTGCQRYDAGVAKLMGATMADMAPYVVLAFFAAQFIAFFNHSQLGIMLAVIGGQALANAELPPTLLMATFILVTMLGNLFIGSASAKYAFFAPVFVPMLMAVGISPELTQAAYRVGDSASNIITPLNPYFVVILVFMQKFAPKAGIGTLVSLMVPYSIAFWLTWTVFLVLWMMTGIPLGPGGPLEYVDPLGG